MDSAVDGAARAFHTALAGDDLAGILRAASRLAGLGPGSTPAGDDVLMGAFHALWAAASPLRAAAPALADAAAFRTTTVSAAWLRAAGGGLAGPAWRRLLVTLAVPGPAGDARIPAAAAAVAATGASSGVWSLRGFSATLTALPARASARPGPLTARRTRAAPAPAAA